MGCQVFLTIFNLRLRLGRDTVNKIKILIVDDDALLREGLKSLLEKEEMISVIYEANDEDSALQQISNNLINLILLDVRLRNGSGLNVLKKIDSFPNKPKVIAVTGLDGVEVIVSLLKAGVNGIVYKLDGYAEIFKAIKATLLSGSYFPDSILKIIQANAHRWDQIPSMILSFQEKELLKAIASGTTTKEIAVTFKMSPATAETYRIRLMKKLGVSNTAALLAYAFRNGLL
jgi:DNA-binding NarL/FixJ family response regulator